jgi:hypothetical protein
MANSIVQAAIDADIAALERVADAPDEPYGFGSDIYCVDDIAEDCREIDPTTAAGARQALGQDLYHRLITERGTLEDDRDYGLGLHQLLNRGVTQASLVEIAGRIRLELEKDDRVDTVTVRLAFTASNNVALSIRVTAEDPNVGGFELVLGSTAEGTVLFEAIQEAV